jgi:hypothetical protein
MHESILVYVRNESVKFFFHVFQEMRNGSLKHSIFLRDPRDSSGFDHKCERRVNLLVYSLSLHRYSYVGFILAFASSIHNKQTTMDPKRYFA